jgi:hypothetical protein
MQVLEDHHYRLPPRQRLELAQQCRQCPLLQITGLPVLLVATYRPEFQPPWVGGSQVTVIALNRLDRNEGASLVHHLAGNLGALPPDISNPARTARSASSSCARG